MTEKASKQWDGLTITGCLGIGVYYAGSHHKDFTLRAPVTGDLINAQQEYPSGPLQLITVDVYRRQLLALGDIPQGALTTELLCGALHESDLAIIADADAELEKKLKPLSAVSPTGEGSSMGLSGTATG
ncbi:hypothetical protein SAMN03159355_01512 [Pseudomonas sp. NFPP10]|uniref:hypothetical protein n=1 Tax=Pseudomonas TaxID=286 RepID=UPI0008840522|nr:MULTISPECIES: hypothetical protein [Pseudomonas]SDA18128.1 hypothetical protein SAMN03159465_01980 [Pseudomonas sp. NFPP12]SEK98659.1 hypothetical protein SAMN03159355_01512 [Pseudomonas sp. NFPP10]SFI57393.1 hypothetical protein SAMN03159416_01930 [Pseudomonas sp. NFPP08]SFM42718.1 hypothetical protein SAMN03159476_01562 [Pseudomonas sp. NFPP05]SFX31165.1 hypothetical protein SAMN03159479_01512 [Pseudomonas sp. NFPP09]